MEIHIEEHTEEMSAGKCIYWLCHIMTDTVDQLKAAMSNDTYGGERTKTSDETSAHKGILGINGSMFTYGEGIPSPGKTYIRDGQIISGLDTNDNIMCIRKNGTMYTTLAGESAQSLISDNVYNTFCFGPTLVENGQFYAIDPAKFNQSAAYPRTVIGMTEPTDYYVLVADGKRPSYSCGLTYKEAATIMMDAGCTYAYNLDGGGSTSLYFNGKLLNSPSDSTGERPCGDILYFTDASEASQSIEYNTEEWRKKYAEIDWSQYEDPYNIGESYPAADGEAEDDDVW